MRTLVYICYTDVVGPTVVAGHHGAVKPRVKVQVKVLVVKTACYPEILTLAEMRAEKPLAFVPHFAIYSICPQTYQKY